MSAALVRGTLPAGGRLFQAASKMATAVVKFVGMTAGAFVGLRFYMDSSFATGRGMRDDFDAKKAYETTVQETKAKMVGEVAERIAALEEDE